MNPSAIRPVSSEFWEQAVALVASAGLPVADLQEGKQFLLGAFGPDGLAGTIGMERCGEAALVRSMTVKASFRGTGIGAALYQALEEQVRKEGFTLLVLLTETAEAYFRNKGYQPVNRDALPEKIQSTAEFSGLCPVSAVAMKKVLA